MVTLWSTMTRQPVWPLMNRRPRQKPPRPEPPVKRADTLPTKPVYMGATNHSTGSVLRLLFLGTDMGVRWVVASENALSSMKHGICPGGCLGKIQKIGVMIPVSTRFISMYSYDPPYGASWCSCDARCRDAADILLSPLLRMSMVGNYFL